MKHHFINLLIASAVVLSLLSGCKGNLIPNTETCPISMYINGDYYSSKEYTYRWGNRPHSFVPGDDGFVVEILRGIAGPAGRRDIYISNRFEGQLEIGKKYSLQSSEWNGTLIDYSVGDNYFRFEATDGWVVFTSIGNGEEPYRLSGEFEFTAVEQKTGEVMEVREGKFENLLTSRGLM